MLKLLKTLSGGDRIKLGKLTACFLAIVFYLISIIVIFLFPSNSQPLIDLAPYMASVVVTVSGGVAVGNLSKNKRDEVLGMGPEGGHA